MAHTSQWVQWCHLAKKTVFAGQSCPSKWKMKRELDSVINIYTKKKERHRGSDQKHKFHRSDKQRPRRESGVSRKTETLGVLLPALPPQPGHRAPLPVLPLPRVFPAAVGNPVFRHWVEGSAGSPTAWRPNKGDLLLPRSFIKCSQFLYSSWLASIKFSQLEFFSLLTITSFEKESISWMVSLTLLFFHWYLAETSHIEVQFSL